MNWNRRAILLIVGVLLVVGAAVFRIAANRKLHSRLLFDAKLALEGSEFAEAESLARRLIAARSHIDEARLVAGEAAARLGADERALAYLEPLLDGQDDHSRIALSAAVDILWDQGDATEAERLLRRLLELEPEQPLAIARLVHLLTLTGRHWESLPYRLTLVRNDQFQVEDLLLWGNTRALIESDELPRLRRLSPDDPLLMLGEASIAVRKNETATAQQLLPRILAARPDLLAAHALTGHLLIERPGIGVAEVTQWNQRLPAGADDHPEIWVIRGLWSAQQDMTEGAARCFWETVRRSPNHQLANYQLALALRQLGKPEAAWFSQRADWLEELERMLGMLDKDRNDLAVLRKTVELNDKLGRMWEVWGWSRVTLLVDPNQTWAREARDRAKQLLEPDSRQVMPESDPARKFDFSMLALPDWLKSPLAQESG